MKPNVEDALLELERLKRRMLDKGSVDEFEAVNTIIATLQGYELPDSVLQKYKCSFCQAQGVKLWREMGTDDRGWCGACAQIYIKLDKIDADGRIESDVIPGIKTDQLHRRGGEKTLLPFVPDKDGSTWAYTSVPPAGVLWWRNLPTYKADK